MKKVVLAMTTFPSRARATTFATFALKHHLAACVQLIPNITSLYSWKGKIQRDREVLVLIKTTAKRMKAIKAWLEEHHPYDIPECVVFSASDGLPSYLQWVVKES